MKILIRLYEMAKSAMGRKRKFKNKIYTDEIFIGIDPSICNFGVVILRQKKDDKKFVIWEHFTISTGNAISIPERILRIINVLSEKFPSNPKNIYRIFLEYDDVWHKINNVEYANRYHLATGAGIGFFTKLSKLNLKSTYEQFTPQETRRSFGLTEYIEKHKLHKTIIDLIHSDQFTQYENIKEKINKLTADELDALTALITKLTTQPI